MEYRFKLTLIDYLRHTWFINRNLPLHRLAAKYSLHLFYYLFIIWLLFTDIKMVGIVLALGSGINFIVANIKSYRKNNYKYHFNEDGISIVLDKRQYESSWLLIGETREDKHNIYLMTRKHGSNYIFPKRIFESVLEQEHFIQFVNTNIDNASARIIEKINTRSMSLKYIVSREDIAAIHWEYIRSYIKSTKFRTILTIFITLFIIWLSYSIASRNGIVIFLGCFVLLGALLLAFNDFSVSKVISESKDIINKPTILSLQMNVFSVYLPADKIYVEIPYDNIMKWGEYRYNICITFRYSRKHLTQLVPKSAFISPNQFDAFTKALTAIVSGERNLQFDNDAGDVWPPQITQVQ